MLGGTGVWPWYLVHLPKVIDELFEAGNGIANDYSVLGYRESHLG